MKLSDERLVQLMHLDFIIQELKLSKIEILLVVKEWYTNGLYAPLLHDESGRDLEEIIDNEISNSKDGKRFDRLMDENLILS
ncbi:MAG: hypothetical protein ABI851_16020 [Saprospiraceae bacterium]